MWGVGRRPIPRSGRNNRSMSCSIVPTPHLRFFRGEREFAIPVQGAAADSGKPGLRALMPILRWSGQPFRRQEADAHDRVADGPFPGGFPKLHRGVVFEESVRVHEAKTRQNGGAKTPRGRLDESPFDETHSGSRENRRREYESLGDSKGAIEPVVALVEAG